MSGLFGGNSPPPPPQEDPEVARLRKLEQERAEAARIRATSDQLGQETLIRNRGLGIASLTSSAFSRRRGLTSLLGSG